MHFIAALIGVALIALILIDAFETILQPRRVTHRFRFARVFYRNTWKIWRAVSALFISPKRREAYLSLFGPLSLLGLFAAWSFALILGFAILHWSFATMHDPQSANASFATHVYLSGTTFFTLGYGDVTPTTTFGHALAILEAGIGFAFLAIIISYLPVLYQAFSRREVTISLLDARAGSPPCASELLHRIGQSNDIATLNSFLIEWEHWAAELLEGQLSFPVLAYYRSQHDNQSWLAALTTILDTCALLLAEVDADNAFRAQLTFAVARHAAVDLSLILKAPPLHPKDRLPDDQRRQMRERLAGTRLRLRDSQGDARLAELRGMYEPFINALADRFLFSLPPIFSTEAAVDNWQRSAWMQRPPGIGSLPTATTDRDHFE